MAHFNNGKKRSEETKKIMSENNKGEKNGFYGKKHTDEAKKLNSEAHSGSKSSRWKGGISGGYRKQFADRAKPEQCEICGAFGIICFDHDHITEKFRGWICKRCNSVLGFVKDNGELLEMLKDYLDKSKI